MTSPRPQDVAIIGAGLAGLALAIALTQQTINVHIFEARSEDAPHISSGILLTPNGLAILDELGIFARITDKCWHATHRTTKNDKDETTRRTLIADESLYGHKNHRIYRRLLINEMRDMLLESKVHIKYNSKFNGVTSDDTHTVTFLINDSPQTTSLLIGADGIYSLVRRYIDPTIQPCYTGTVGVLSHIDRSSVTWPYPDYDRSATIQGTAGALFYMPETRDGEDLMIGIQRTHPDQLTRQAWETLGADTEALCSFYRRNYADWGPTARSIIDAVTTTPRGRKTMYLWPFVRIPEMSSWSSPTGNVVIVGDAAHALPPSSAQGVNQALEDVYSLTQILTSTTTDSPHENRTDALREWHAMRQSRIDLIFDYAANKIGVERLPAADRERLVREGKVKDARELDGFDDMSWLYKSGLIPDEDGGTQVVTGSRGGVGTGVNGHA